MTIARSLSVGLRLLAVALLRRGSVRRTRSIGATLGCRVALRRLLTVGTRHRLLSIGLLRLPIGIGAAIGGIRLHLLALHLLLLQLLLLRLALAALTAPIHEKDNKTDDEHDWNDDCNDESHRGAGVGEKAAWAVSI